MITRDPVLMQDDMESVIEENVGRRQILVPRWFSDTYGYDAGTSLGRCLQARRDAEILAGTFTPPPIRIANAVKDARAQVRKNYLRRFPWLRMKP